jgi:radical SAM-linked protein
VPVPVPESDGASARDVVKSSGFVPSGAAGVAGVTQRVIVRYAKRGRMRFASHRDIARAVERGVRRAGLPIAYSAGFTPHPKISYAGAAPTGTASEAEYLELSFTRACAVSEVRERLDAALPDGIDVIEVTEDPATLGALPLEASQWQVVLPGVPPAQAASAVADFLACPTLEVERLTSKGPRRVDARAAVITMETYRSATDGGDTGNAKLRMVVRHVIPAVRPDDILAVLSRLAALAPSSPPVVTRLAQGALSAEAASTGAAAGRLSLPVWPQDPGAAAKPQVRGTPGGPQLESTRPGGAATQAAARPAGACDQLPRGADGPLRPPAPGSLTGDCPDARERATRQRTEN